jgi:6-pyruvoyltetrahydropterin/6-carboxytetrahydropterin synthase
MIVTVSREESFNAAHRLHVPEWSSEKNQEYFGLCNRPNYHGHNYRIIVTVSGEVNPQTGYVVDMKTLRDILKKEVTDKFDHRNLNLDTAEFKDLNPTAENIAVVIWNKVRAKLDPALSLSITLYETDRNFVQYSGE